MPSDYGYLNARIKAMRSRLLERGTLDELLSARDFRAFWELLASTPYGRPMEEEASRGGDTLHSLEAALRRHLVTMISKLLGISEGAPRTLLGIAVRRWDLLNLKTILRGKHSRRSEDDIVQDLIPAGTLSEIRLRELLKQDDLESLALTLATWDDRLAVPLKEKGPQYTKDRDLVSLELALDRFYYDEALALVRDGDYSSRRIREMLQGEIDAINLQTAFRLPREDVTDLDRDAFFVPGGKDLPHALFLQIARAPTLSAGWKETSRVVGESLDEPRSLGEAQDWLERTLTRRFARWYVGDPLSVDVAVGYLWMLYNEMSNLRLLARGKALEVPADRLEKELAFV